MNLFDYTATENPYFVSLGDTCRVKQMSRLEKKGVPKEVLPFDFINTTEDSIVKTLESNFEGWTNPENFYVPFVTQNKMKVIVPHLYMKNNAGIRFFHEVSIDDLNKTPALELFLKKDEATLQKGFSDEAGVPVKKECLAKVMLKNDSCIQFLATVIASSTQEIKTKQPNLVFIRHESNTKKEVFKKGILTKCIYFFKKLPLFHTKKVDKLFDALKKYCNGTPFILIRIKDVYGLEGEKTTEGVLLLKDEINYCIAYNNYIIDGEDPRLSLKKTMSTIMRTPAKENNS